MATQDDMAVINDGDQLNDGYFNDLALYRKTYSSAVAVTHTGNTSYTTKDVFTVGQDGAMIIGVKVKWELKSSDAATAASARLTLTGTNLGTIKISSVNYGITGSTPFADDSPSGEFLNTTQSTTYTVYGASFNPAIELKDATTTCNVQIQISDGSKTVSLQNYEIEFLYMGGFLDE